MSKKVLTVSADDFAKVVSCLGFITTLVGLALPEDSPQQALTIKMGDDLIEVLLKYSSEEDQEHLNTMRQVLLANEADTSVSN